MLGIDNSLFDIYQPSLIISLTLQIILFIFLVFSIKIYFKFNYKNTLLGITMGGLSYIGLILSYVTSISFYAFFYNIGIDVIFEEVAKIIPSIILIKKYELNMRDSIGVGSLIGLGFSFIENINYLGGIQRTLFRGTISSCSHIIYTAIFVYGIRMSIQNKDHKWVLYFFLSFIMHWSINLIILNYVGNIL